MRTKIQQLRVFILTELERHAKSCEDCKLLLNKLTEHPHSRPKLGHYKKKELTSEEELAILTYESDVVD